MRKKANLFTKMAGHLTVNEMVLIDNQILVIQSTTVVCSQIFGQGTVELNFCNYPTKIFPFLAMVLVVEEEWE